MQDYSPVYSSDSEFHQLEISLVSPLLSSIHQYQTSPFFRVHIRYKDLFPNKFRLRRDARAIQGALRDYYLRTLGLKINVQVTIRAGSYDILAFVGGFVGSAITAKAAIDFVKEYPKIREGGHAIYKDVAGLLRTIRDHIRK